MENKQNRQNTNQRIKHESNIYLNKHINKHTKRITLQTSTHNQTQQPQTQHIHTYLTII